MYNFKKLISLAIVLVMVMSVMPMVVSADNPVFTAPTEYLFEDFSNFTGDPNTADGVNNLYFYTTSNGNAEISGDKLKFNGGQNGSRLNVGPVSIGSNPVIIEYDQYFVGYNAKEGIYLIGGGQTTSVTSSNADDRIGVKYVVYDPSLGKATAYKSDFTVHNSVDVPQNCENITFRLNTNFSTNASKYVEMDYFAFYDYTDMAIKLEDITRSGATLKTTLPVDITNTTLSIGGVAVNITKVPDTYNTYTVEFASQLGFGTEYTLAGNIAYLGGDDDYVASYTFKTPAKEYAAPTERYFNDFEGLTEVPSEITKSSDGVVSIVDGKLHLGRSGGTQARANVSGIPVGSNPIVFEYNQYKSHNVNQEGVYIGGKAVYSGDAYNGATPGARYVIYYPQADSAAVYTKDFTQPLATKDAVGLTAPVESVTFRFHTYLSANDRYFEYDYLAAYDLDDAMAIKLEDVSVKGATLKTTIPVDVDTASLNIGGTPVTLTKAPDTYNTYKLEFGTTLSELADYTLSGSLPYLTGTTAYTVNYAFKTPVKTFADVKPYEYYFEDFDGITEIPEGIGATQNGVISLNNGKLHYTTNGEKINNISYDCRLGITDIPTDGKTVIIELSQSGNSSIENDYYIYANNSGSSTNRLRVYKDDTLTNATKYIVYNPTLNTATPYINGLTPSETVNTVAHSGDKFGVGLWATINSTDKYLEYDYIAVYELASEFMYKVEEVSTLGAVISTTLPIDIEASEFMIGDIEVDIEKTPNTYNKYNLTFEEELSVSGSYTLTGEVAYIGGTEKAEVSYAFENPVKPLVFTSLAVDETEGVKAAVTATNISKLRGYDVYLIIAAYNSEDKYIDAAISTVKVVANAENAVYTTDALEVEGAAYYRAYLWNLHLEPQAITQ